MRRLLIVLALLLILFGYMASQYSTYKQTIRVEPWDAGWDKVPENAPPLVVIPRHEVNKMITNQQRMMRQLGVQDAVE